MKLYKALFATVAFLQIFAFASDDINIELLTVGTSINGSVSQGEAKIYQVLGASKIRLYNLSNDIDMITATENGNYCYPAKSGTTDEICEVNPSDTVYIEVYGYQGGSFSLIAEGKVSPRENNDSILLNENDSVSKGEWKYYMGRGASLAKLYNLSSDLDMYVKSGSKPSFNSYDCRPFKTGTTDEICNQINPENEVYIGIYGYTSGNFSLLVTGKGSTSDNVTREDISRKNKVLIAKDGQAGICENINTKERFIQSGFINPIFLEEPTNDVTCATYNKIDGLECAIFDAQNRGDVSCAIGYDSYQAKTRSRNINNNDMLNSVENIIYDLGL